MIVPTNHRKSKLMRCVVYDGKNKTLSRKGNSYTRCTYILPSRMYIRFLFLLCITTFCLFITNFIINIKWARYK